MQLASFNFAILASFTTHRQTHPRMCTLVCSNVRCSARCALIHIQMHRMHSIDVYNTTNKQTKNAICAPEPTLPKSASYFFCKHSHRHTDRRACVCVRAFAVFPRNVVKRDGNLMRMMRRCPFSCSGTPTHRVHHHHFSPLSER